ncbi:MAG: multiheme c-type cytochrome [bacterium]
MKWFYVILVFLLVSSFEASAGKYDGFSKAQVCQEKCHDMIYGEWKDSVHANAYRDPFYQRMARLASRETGGKSDKYCIRCHAPVASLAGLVPPVDGRNMTDVAKEGITCDFCHTVTGFQGHEPGNGLYLSTPGNTKYAPLKDSETKNHKCAESKLHSSSRFCGMCHQLEHYETGTLLISTFLEWEDAVEAAEDEAEDTGKKPVILQCQQCHMSKGVNKFEPRIGQSAQLAPIRPHVGVHRFDGANVFLHNLLDLKVDHEKRKQRLSEAARLELVDIGRSGATGLAFSVKVTNVGAGHKLPTGMLESRHIWLEVTVTDAGGETFYRSGQLDGDYRLAPDTRMFRAVLGDKNGNPTLKIWEAAQKLSDTRLIPWKPKIEKFQVKNLPGGVPLKIRVALNYRPTYQEQADLVFKGNERKIVPVVTMTEIVKEVPGV